jgi:sporulation integral membrane protein YlbJ
MRPLFHLPGAASLAVVLGFCSGFPTGAAVTAGLWREGLISDEEGARLICFTNNSGPLYISVALATGLLACPQAAIILAIAHYGGNLLLGIALGWQRRQPSPQREQQRQQTQTAPRPLGIVLRAAAETAIRNILLIACYMVLFSVITALLVSEAWATAHPLAAGIMQGCFEMTLGLDTLADAGLPLTQTIPLAAAILAFGGFSVQMQVLAMVAETPIPARRYLLCRLLHVPLSWIIARLLCPLFSLPLATATLGTSVSSPPYGGWLLMLLLATGVILLAGGKGLMHNS